MSPKFAELAVEAVTVISAIVTIVAATLSVIQLRMARSQTTQLDEIGRALSTRYVGIFPEFMKHIVEVVNSAERELIIFCNFPAQARFSDPGAWLLYRQALERKVRQPGLSVIFTCLSEQLRLARSAAQFPPEEMSGTLTQWKKDGAKRRVLQGLVNDYGIVSSVDEITPVDFLSLLEAADQEMLSSVLHPPAIVYQISDVALDFWIADRNRAVFGFRTPGVVGPGFITTDQKLIAAFLDIKETYHSSASPDAPQRLSVLVS